MTVSEAAFRELLKLRGLPQPEREYRFHSTRKWRFDYVWRDQMIALEVEGGTWRKGGGAHRGKGFLRDLEKYNAATILGWRLLRVTPRELATDKTCDLVEILMKTGEMARLLREARDQTR